MPTALKYIFSAYACLLTLGSNCFLDISNFITELLVFSLVLYSFPFQLMTTLPFHLPKPKHRIILDSSLYLTFCMKSPGNPVPSTFRLYLQSDHLSPPGLLPPWVHCHHLLSRLFPQPPDKSPSPHLCSAATCSEHRNWEILTNSSHVYYFSTQNLPVFSVSPKSKGQSPSLTCQDPLTSLTSSPTAPLPSPSHS